MNRFLNAGVLILVTVIIAAIILYLIKAKRRGKNCIGCPYAKQCGRSCAEKKKQSAENRLILPGFRSE